MTETQPSLTVSDTTFWIARFRADESARPDALFCDPYAAQLAGTATRSTPTGLQAWPLVARTKLIDDIVERTVSRGVDCVVNLAAGLDTRPYRLKLPGTLRWVEADLPQMIDYKEQQLASATHCCALSRERVDLTAAVARRAFLERALCGVQRALVITEGLLPYLEERDVIALGHDLAARAEISGWILDVHSPGVLRIAQRATDKHLAEGSRMRFAPSAGVGFFRQLGFEPVEVSSLARAAARMRRMSLLMSLSTWLPEPKPDNLGLRPWAAVAWLARAKQTVRASRPRPKSH